MGTGNKPGFGTGPGTAPKAPKKDTAKDREDKIYAWADKAEENFKLKTDMLIPNIDLKGNMYLDRWLTQMISAKGDSNPPPEESEKHWFITLAGNLLWAASVFVPAANVIKAGAAAAKVVVSLDKTISLGQTMYDTLTVVGAVTGGMAVDESGGPTGKDVVAAALNAKRKKMGDELKMNTERYADDLIKSGQFNAADYRAAPMRHLDIVSRMLWTNLFPMISFEGYTDIYKMGLAAINNGLKEFKIQYKAWKDQVHQWATYEATVGAGRSFQSVNRAKYEERVAYYTRSMRWRFNPKLNFI